MKSRFYFIILLFFSLAVPAQTDSSSSKQKENAKDSVEQAYMNTNDGNSDAEYNRGICFSMNFLCKNALGNQNNSLPNYIERPDSLFKFGELDFSLRPSMQPFIGYYFRHGGNYQILEISYYSVKRDLKLLSGSTSMNPFKVYALRYTYNFIANKNTKLKLNYNVAGMASITGSNMKLNDINEDRMGKTYTIWSLKSNGLLVQLSPNLVYRMRKVNFMLAANFNLFSVINEKYNLHKYYESNPPFSSPAYYEIKKIDNKKTYFRWASDYFKSNIFYNSIALRVGYNF